MLDTGLKTTDKTTTTNATARPVTRKWLDFLANSSEKYRSYYLIYLSFITKIKTNMSLQTTPHLKRRPRPQPRLQLRPIHQHQPTFTIHQLRLILQPLLEMIPALQQVKAVIIFLLPIFGGSTNCSDLYKTLEILSGLTYVGFIVDDTGSMRNEISAVKNWLLNCVNGTYADCATAPTGGWVATTFNDPSMFNFTRFLWNLKVILFFIIYK